MTVSSFPENHLEQIARALADAATHAQLTDLFDDFGVDAPAYGQGSKWFRIREGLSNRQRRDGCGNAVAHFVQTIMEPVRFTGDAERFSTLREDLNEVLAFSGLVLGEDGKLRTASRAATVTEAQQRAKRLRTELERRKVHPEVLKYCRPELLQENYFHAVLEATKSVAQKIRDRTGLTGDGASLAQKAFGGSTPLLAINTLQSDTERSEQSGFVNLIMGAFGTFRNVTAHAPKIAWVMSEQDALDLLSLASYLHRRIDGAARTNP